MALRLVPLLLCAALLGGCAAMERSFSSMTDGLTDISLRNGPQWGGPRVGVEESLTVQRVRAGGAAGPTADMAVLRPEAGDVWPREEAPRATLANPDEALRGFGNQRMGLSDPATEAARPARRGSSSPPPDALNPIQPQNVVPPTVPMPAPPPRPLRADEVGGVLPTLRGPATVTTRSGNVGTTMEPGGVPGVAIRDGGVTTILRPGLPPEQVPTPR
ncbi:hypothetical protein ACI6QG_05795 [Roseococcus sp. DSY-14]|uniref:hypothetical protein n=1 Tax=Roseococcus sp. DSY-14 TaxID=3369650 RepID=UPI00387ADDFE